MCRLRATADGKTLRAILEGILTRQFTVSIESGRHVVSTAEAGGATEFGMVPGLPPGKLISLASKALEWLDKPGNEASTTALPTQVKRLRPCYSRRLL
jgi:hypothetical protein